MGIRFSLRVLFLAIFVGLFVFWGLAASVLCICRELSVERRYQSTFGDGWKAAYQTDLGSLSSARWKVFFLATAVLVICFLLLRLVRSLSPNSRNRRRRRRSEDLSPTSRIDRIMRWRRNAFVAIPTGVIVILISIVLLLFNTGLFTNFSDQSGVGMLGFVAGYSTVVFGCSNWLKAKCWTDAVVFIAFMPLVILFIPFLRLIFVAVPGLLSFSIIMMTMILIAVVFVLPDKSGLRKKIEYDRSRLRRGDWL